MCGSRLAEQIAEPREDGLDGAISSFETVRTSVRQLAEDVAMEKAGRSEALACVERRLDTVSAALYAQVAELRASGCEASRCAQVAELRVAELATQLAGLAELPARSCAEGRDPDPASRAATAAASQGLEELSERIAAYEALDKVTNEAEKLTSEVLVMRREVNVTASAGLAELRVASEEVSGSIAVQTADLQMRGQQEITDSSVEAIGKLERRLEEISTALDGQVAEIRASTDAVTARFDAQMLELRERADDDAVSIMAAVRGDVCRLAEDLNKERESRCDQLSIVEQRLDLMSGSLSSSLQVAAGQGDGKGLACDPAETGAVATEIRQEALTMARGDLRTAEWYQRYLSVSKALGY